MHCRLMVTPAELVKGKVYFVCSYVHPKYPIPDIRAYVYIGKNVIEEDRLPDVDEYCFEIPERYFEQEIKADLTEDELAVYQPPGGDRYMRIETEYLDTVIESVADMEAFVAGLKHEPFYNDIF